MARLSPKVSVLKALFAKSGNECAFPGCTQPLINYKKQFVGQLCHIEGALPGGERYNPNQTDEDRRSYNNLLLMCYPHHIETKDVNEFPVASLKKIKSDHEAKFENNNFMIDEKAFLKLKREMEIYWDNVEKLNTMDHAMAELAFDISVKGSFFDIIKNCRDNMHHLQGLFKTLKASDENIMDDFVSLLKRKNIDLSLFNDVPYYENPFANRNWEIHHMGAANLMQRLNIDLMHLEIKFLEEYLKTNSDDREARDRLESLKESFAELAQHAMVID